jgi:DnaA N-terminal domain
VSHAAIAALLARDDLSAGERLVAWSLASFANRDQLAWPGMAAGSARAGLSRSRYLEARDRLVRRGLLEIETPGVGRGHASTVKVLFAQFGPWHDGEVNAELLEAVLGYSPTRGPARLLLAALAALADQNGGVEGFTTDELCRTAGLANSTYRRARAALLASREVTVDDHRGGRGRTCRWTVRRPVELAAEPIVAPKRRVAPQLRARPLMAAATSGGGANAGDGPIPSGVSTGKGPIGSGVLDAKSPSLSGVSPVNDPSLSGVYEKGPSLSGVSAANHAKTPPETPPPNARAGREPKNPRTREHPPTPLEGGNAAGLAAIEETYVTERGRKRKRHVRIDLDEVRRRLGLPTATDHEDWRRTGTLLREAVGESVFAIWLEPIELIAIDSQDALVIAPPPATRDWIQKRFGRLLSECVRRVSRELRFANDAERVAFGRHEETHLATSERGDLKTTQRSIS